MTKKDACKVLWYTGIVLVALSCFLIIGCTNGLTGSGDDSSDNGNEPLGTVPQTGQSQCWDQSGNSIDCAGSGQDGELQKGVAWPDPRFIDNGDGTITDMFTGLMWEQAPSGSSTDWEGAFTRIDTINGSALGGHTDWRLPNRFELMTLVNCGYTADWNGAWLIGQGFSSIVGSYWSSSTNAATTDNKWRGAIGYDSRVYAASQDLSYYTIGIRTGTVGTVAVPRTGQSDSYHEGDDGYIQAGKAWPDPRFTDNGNSTVTDNLTGLIWEQSPDTATTDWNGAFARIADLNSSELGGRSDWRLPNKWELASLIHIGETSTFSWLNSGPFSDVISSYYWSSTTNPHGPTEAWIVRMSDGYIGAVFEKTTSQPTWGVCGPE